MVLDVFEVVMLVGACFLVNYITADSKTNWAEGYTLVSFYIIIVSAPWSIESSPSDHLSDIESAYRWLTTF
jgi:hypothetical protein